MKYLKKVLYLTIIMFCFSNRVNAGVCEGLSLDPDTNTCKYNSGFTVSRGSTLKDNIDGGHFMKPGYIASNGGNSYMALCLDPGLTVPQVPLSIIRELSSDYNNFSDKVDQYDKGLYIMFQFFYQDLVASLKANNSITVDNDYKYKKFRAYLENSARVWTFIPYFGFDYLGNGSYSDGLATDVSKYKTCASYIEETLAASGTSYTREQCFGTVYADHNISMIKAYYNAAKDGNYIWKNPLKIVNDVKEVKENGIDYYLYTFDVTFNDGTYSFFDGNYSKGVSYRDFQLPSAYFSLNDLTVNGESCKDSGKCATYSAGGVINDENVKGENKWQFIVKLTEEQYLAYKNSSSNGKVNVTMSYSFQHPLNIENLFIGRVDLKNTSQRMLVIKNYVHNGTVTSGEETSKKVCTYEATIEPTGKTMLTNFFDSNGKNLGSGDSAFKEFLSSCGCPNSITQLQLGTHQSGIYDEKCRQSESGPINRDPEYKNYDKVCKDVNYDSVKDNTNYESFEIGYTNLTKTINNYCSETCSETIKVDNLKGKYSTVAGTAFQFNKYPELTAIKSCTVKVDYNKWQEDYKDVLKELVEKYNNLKYYEAGKGASPSYSVCGTGCTAYDRDGITCTPGNSYYLYRARYTFTYTNYEVNDDGTSLSEKNSIGDVTTECDGSYDWNKGYADAQKAFRSLSTSVTSLQNLQKDLKQCNNRLFGTSETPTTAKQFYYFSQQLNYYYEQTIYGEDNKLQKMSNNKYGLTNLFSGIDDSQFTFTTSSQDDKTQNTGTQNCDILTETGKSTESIITYTDINGNTSREVTYNVEYSPKIHKYINNYTSLIVDEETLKNQEDKKQKEYIDLGYSYDTLVNADARINNNYYYFTKLGDSNNLIFEHYKESDKNAIIKYCTYQITNDIMNCNDSSANNCSGSQENDPVNPYSNIAFRIVDPNNIDPNDRLLEEKGFKNWNNDKGKAVKNAIEESDVFNPNNLEYSFTLDSATIQSIRKYNENKSYSNVNSEKIDGVNSLLECDNGTKCLSSFITAASVGNTELFNKKFALKTDGRDTWRVYKDENGEKFVDIEKR